jgi:hypothetical protein
MNSWREVNSSGRAGACYVTSRQGQGSLNRNSIVALTEQKGTLKLQSNIVSNSHLRAVLPERSHQGIEYFLTFGKQ